jgi:hypothetical protein
MTNRIWTKPPIVYEVTNPSAHKIKRITKIVQSIFQLLSRREPTLSDFLSAQCVSPFFLVGLAFGFRSGVNRAAAMTHQFLSFFDDSFGNLPKFLPTLIQVIESLPAALAKRFPRLLARKQRGHQPTDGPQTQTDKQVGEFGFTIGFHTSTLSFITLTLPLALDHLQVIDDLFDAFHLRRNRSNVGLLLGGLDFAGQINNPIVGFDSHT